ncbi:hypothetical protein Sinac_3672 [Singulisphaera acidiphila DSM 18658]|uniref:Uncharacterized protein n=1 Tax=Singulisphaera acidiphila (strain ATCC BAA-1392 / DSM 18658 / VKM B-2454 / MOB10) TaxID=886293 RepID=L0DGJ0_SINAD|nr:hypothetical protein Sinac_3672 [Singulisphaera acidiphila DSM 18658]
MPIDERWQQLRDSDWDELARSWLAGLEDTSEAPRSGIGLTVVLMNFTTPPELDFCRFGIQMWRASLVQ